MGGEWSSAEREKSPDPWWGNTESGTLKNVPAATGENIEKTEENVHRKVNQEEMDAFKRDIAKKRELRRTAIASVQSEMKKLKTDLEAERCLRKAVEEERDQIVKIKCDKMLSDQVEKLKSELEEEKSKRMEMEEENNTLKEKEGELEAVEHQVKALKEVALIGREMLRIRELQVNELKKKLEEIEQTMPTLPEELRLEYEAQIQNIRKLRTLYEERAMATRTEHQQERERDTAKINMLEVKVNELQEEIQEHKEKNTEIESKITKYEETVDEKVTEIESLQDHLYSSTVECHSLKSQMKIINHLFSQVLAGPEFDLDKLIRLLKENHGLITDLTATGDTNEVAALLLDIAEKVDEDSAIPGSSVKPDYTEESLQKEKEEIASNLSKVWRVLVELLSHHKDVNQNNAGGSESCYKSVDTPSGPRLVISVSQTFLTLKDLILEKNSLVKEVGRLKTLNKHLETRMHGQERRLSTVSTELKKTWSVVSKLRAQHKQLHNHEKILRYELQHKRQMLTELKQELEHCREKWDRARQKNTQSEEDWKQLRKEFALRKTRKLSNSAESGYEEEDSHSSPSEETSEPSDSVDVINVIAIKQDTLENSDTDLSEEDVENSDGNSYETVIDLLDIACLESQIENENLTNTEELISFIESQEALTLTDNELTEGLGHIESFELASELDICQTIQTPDFNSPFPSSSSSPIPTETEDLNSSEVDDISEEIPRSTSPYHQLHFTEKPIVVPDIPQDNLLFGSHSAQNISKFLEGLLVTDNNIHSIEETNSMQEGISEEQSIQCQSLKILNCEEQCQMKPLSGKVSQEESSVNVQSERKDLTKQACTTEPKIERQILSTSENDLLTEEDSTLETNAPLLTTSSETNLKFEVPKILIISENDTTVQPDQEILEIEDNLTSSNETSIFDNESVAHAIQLCLQDIKSSIPIISNHEDKEETEVNNITDLTLCRPNDVMETVQTKESKTEVDIINNIVINETVVENQNSEDNKVQNQIPIIENQIKIHSESDIMKQVIEPSTNSVVIIEDSNSDKIKKSRTPKEILEARAARLKRLEDQCKSLFSKMSATSKRSDIISNKLEELHEQYGPSQYPKHSNSEIPTTSRATVFNSADNLLQGNLKPVNSEKNLDSLNPGSEVDNRLKDPSVLQTTATGIDTNPCCSKRLQPENIAGSESTENVNLDKRAARLKRLEDQCKLLYAQVSKTNQRGNVMCDRLQELHDHYRSDEESTSSETSDQDNQTQESKSEKTQPK